MMTVNFQKKTKVQHKTVAVLSSLALLGVSLAGCSRAPTQQDQQAASGQAATQSNAGASDKGTIKLLNVSYDVARDFYKSYNPMFIKDYETKNSGKTVDIQQSHGGSSKQALAVANGLQADVVSMNQGSDVELLVKKGLVA